MYVVYLQDVFSNHADTIMDVPFKPDSFYHIYNHAIGFENLFKASTNYAYFLANYAKYIEPICTTYAYCLMPNHFHILIKVRSEEALLAFYKQKHTETWNPKKLQILNRYYIELGL